MKDLSVTVPVYSEERDLEPKVLVLHEFLAKSSWTWEIVIVDNGSTDGTWPIATRLEETLSGVEACHIPVKGRGRALRQAWLTREARALSYMDVDLSTDLACLPALVNAVLGGGYDLAVGSRLLEASQVRRSLKRELISWTYNWLVRAVFAAGCSDAQCGFKAISREAALELVPKVQDNDWFFDTELLLKAERLGYRIFDLPVAWTEDADSRVRILRTAWADLKGLWRVWREFRRESAS